MASGGRLSAADKGFFSQVATMIFMNPFGDQRAALLSRLQTEFGPQADEPATASILPELKRRIEGLDNKGLGTITRFEGEERRVMEAVFLYCVYHRCVAEFDKLIERELQRRSGNLSFAGEVLRQLGAHGFSEQDAARYFAIFYQLRRAFFFIIKSIEGDSASMRQFRSQLWSAVFTHDMHIYDRNLWNRMEDFSTLLLGETGTGKGAAAASIGRSAFIPYDRAKREFAVNFTETFLAINLSQFPESLIESELFGHRRGAFTGAVDNHSGVFEACSPHGALFLDEIGDVGEPIQIKLLRVLQERTFSPVGSHDSLRFAGRVIAATNHPLADLRRQGRFRDDFFYRLCSDVITVPPLRQRIQESPRELEQLVVVTLARITGDSSSQLSDQVLSTLRRDLPVDYEWPGNVRELEQAVRRILLTGHYIAEQPALPVDEIERLSAHMRAGTIAADDLLRGYLTLLHRRYGTYEEVGRRAGIDRRTARKYLTDPNA
jgi:transcriptional regulator of acetoin/glycerol metabolism